MNLMKLLSTAAGIASLIAVSTLSYAQISQLPACSGKPTPGWSDCVGTETLPNGNKYVGEYKIGLPSGKGTYTWPNGDKYVGNFKDSKRTGWGVYTFANGRQWVGEWLDQNLHGLAVDYNPDRSIRQSGRFVNNNLVESMRLDPLRFAYVSQSPTAAAQSRQLPACVGSNTTNWDNCVGTYTWPDGDKYVGEWKNNKRHGQGTTIFRNGTKYVGEYSDDKRNGRGTLTFSDGAQYVGQFSNGKFNGRGIYTFANSSLIYEVV